MTTQTRNEAAERTMQNLHAAHAMNVPLGWGNCDTEVCTLLRDALAVEYGRGAKVAMRLQLTDDHEVCDQQKRDAVAAARRQVIADVRKRLPKALSTMAPNYYRVHAVDRLLEEIERGG